MDTEPTDEEPRDTGARGVWRRWRHRPLTGAIGGDLALATLLVAGCGVLFVALAGGGGSSSASETDGDASAGAGSDQALAYSECMRENGAPGFPDPVDGQVMITPQSGLDLDSPEFQEAQEACQDKAPEGLGGGGPDGEVEEQVLAFAQCMRDNGVPDFPDPDTSGGGVRISPGDSGFDPNSPEFQEAQEQCGELLGGIGSGMRRSAP